MVSCNGKFSVGKHFESKTTLVYTEEIYRVVGIRKIALTRKERGTAYEKLYCLNKQSRRSIEQRYTYTGLQKVGYVPVKGLMHDVTWDPLWWFKIGPALSQSVGLR